MNEQQNIEFKSQWSDTILKTACAFANTIGGSIYIGIDDNGNPVELKIGRAKQSQRKVENNP
ncbi:MAG: ATP-binding protein [Bacteroidales bacterium]|nr:ATP-binding protein [Bacteroidales bacterium]